MKNEIKILFAVAICLIVIPSLVSAFGEVAGPVVIYATVGGSGTGQWGLFNDNPVIAKLSVQGDAAKYLSFPSNVSLEGNAKISYTTITANIPTNSGLKEGTNITGTLYALTEGQPGQVQINLQVTKNVFIIIGNPPKGSSSQSQTVTATQQAGNLFSGFSFLPALDFNLVGAIVVGIVIFLAFVFISRRFGLHQVETKVKPQRKRR